MLALFKDLHEVVRRYAVEKDVNLVMQHADFTDHQYWGAPNLAFRMGNRTLLPLYSGEEIDISQEILARLNAAYRKRPAPKEIEERMEPEED